MNCKKYIDHFFFVLIFISTCNHSFGQLCEGNTSEVLFFEDFGSGDNYGPELDEGVTTYNYGSIGNGNYVVTNTSGLNGSLWHDAPDHTPDDNNGYMLLFDASVSPGYFYQNTFSELCENTDYVFSCFVTNIVTISACGGSSIEPNLRFIILDPDTDQELGFVDTGTVPTTNESTWTEYAISFRTLMNQTDIKIELINIASGGCGNDLAIDDFSLRRCDPIEEIVYDLCDSETGEYQIGPFTFTEPGYYEFELDIENSCNTRFIQLTLEGQQVVNDNQTIKFCEGDTIYSFGFEIFQDSLIIDTVSVDGNCISINRYEYIAKASSIDSQFIHLCNNDSTQIGNIWYSQSETLVDSFINEMGCDSIIVIEINKTEIEIEKNGVPSSLELGDEIQIQANTSVMNLDQIIWEPIQDVSCSHCLDPIYVPSSTEMQTLTVIDSNSQCRDSIQFLIEPCSPSVYLPNVFSPNDDNVNDAFLLFTDKCILSINYVKIFDRWGGLIHFDENLQSSDILWDGYTDNKISRTGVYVYLIELTLLGGKKQLLSGDVTLFN